jgi:N-acetylated-alpha-linked acidic dipeptidase
VYDKWKNSRPPHDEHRTPSNAPSKTEDVHIGDLGSGSDYTPFLQRMGVPATDVSSDGPYGVYHSAFDNYAWFIQNADPHFVYLQEMARVIGLETIRMADTDVLPYDYVAYAKEIASYLEAAQRKAAEASMNQLDFASANAAAGRFLSAAQLVSPQVSAAGGDLDRINRALRQTEAALLSPAGLPNRPWYRHTIYAPGEYTGYAAVVIPGVNEAIEAKDTPRASQQLAVLTQTLDRAANTVLGAR